MKHSTRKKQAWADRVLKDIERQLESGRYAPEKKKQQSKEDKKQKQDAYFAKNYDKLKTVQFKSKKQLSMTKHFYMPKVNSDFHYYSGNALAIYPVLCGRADFYDDSVWVRISRENIGKLAGISPNCVDKGVSVLRRMAFNLPDSNGELVDTTPFLQRREWQDQKRRGYEYLPSFFRYGVEGLGPKRWSGHYFPFHTCIVNSGVWAQLSRKAKSLYIAMRSKAFFDQQAYEVIEGIYIPTLDEVHDEQLEQEPNRKKFLDRKWDVCNSSLKALFELARMPYKDTRALTGELEQTGLIEKVHETKSIFKVYLRPQGTPIKNY